jgi:hypothetical protein
MSDLLGRKTEEVEAILGNVSEACHKQLESRSNRTRRSEDGCHYYFDTIEEANDSVRRALAEGAHLVEFIPVRESLEDYFVRLQSGVEQ